MRCAISVAAVTTIPMITSIVGNGMLFSFQILVPHELEERGLRGGSGGSADPSESSMTRYGRFVNNV